MKYSYTKGAKTIEYNATSLKTGTIAAKSFIIPSKDYVIKKYNPGGIAAAGEMGEEEDEEGTEEEEMETPVVGATTTPSTDTITNKAPATNMPPAKQAEVKPPSKN
jgi:hypothetical protein